MTKKLNPDIWTVTWCGVDYVYFDSPIGPQKERRPEGRIFYVGDMIDMRVKLNYGY